LITRIRHNPNILIDLFKENLGGYLTVDNTDGVRIIIINRDILHIRASGNAPEIRCYAESCTEQKAKEYVNILIKFLESQ
ncbi:phosphomannomutase, partial [Escherichia coli]